MGNDCNERFHWTICRTWLPPSVWIFYFSHVFLVEYRDPNKSCVTNVIDISTARPKWRLDGSALSGHLLHSLANHAYANRYHHHLVKCLVRDIIMDMAFIL